MERNCERLKSLTHFIELGPQWRLEVHIEIKVIYSDLSTFFLDCMHGQKMVERIFIHTISQVKKMWSFQCDTQPSTTVFFACFLLRPMKQSGIITVCAFQRMSASNALDWILSTGYWFNGLSFLSADNRSLNGASNTRQSTIIMTRGNSIMGKLAQKTLVEIFYVSNGDKQFRIDFFDCCSIDTNYCVNKQSIAKWFA